MPAVLVVAPADADPRLAPYLEAIAAVGHVPVVVGAEAARAGDATTGGDVVGVVAVGRTAAAAAAVLARRHGVMWHAPEAVRRVDDRLQQLGRLTALGTAVPRFAAVECATGAGLERLAGLPPPWRATAVPGGASATVGDVDGLRALAARWGEGGEGEAVATHLAVEAALGSPAWLVVGLLDEGALRVVAIVDALAGDPPWATASHLVAPSSLPADAQAHLAGLVAVACGALELRHGPVLARAAAIEGRACLIDVAPGTLELPASNVLRVVGPRGEVVDLATLVVRQAVGAALEGYALDGSSCEVRLA